MWTTAGEVGSRPQLCKTEPDSIKTPGTVRLCLNPRFWLHCSGERQSAWILSIPAHSCCMPWMRGPAHALPRPFFRVLSAVRKLEGWGFLPWRWVDLFPQWIPQAHCSSPVMHSTTGELCPFKNSYAEVQNPRTWGYGCYLGTGSLRKWLS